MAIVTCCKLKAIRNPTILCSVAIYFHAPIQFKLSYKNQMTMFIILLRIASMENLQTKCTHAII